MVIARFNSYVVRAITLPDNVDALQLVSIIIRSLGIKNGAISTLPADVGATDGYAGAVAAALSYRLVEGYEDNTFRPEQPITRAEAAVIVDRAARLASWPALLPARRTRCSSRSTIAARSPPGPSKQ